MRRALAGGRGDDADYQPLVAALDRMLTPLVEQLQKAQRDGLSTGTDPVSESRSVHDVVWGETVRQWWGVGPDRASARAHVLHFCFQAMRGPTAARLISPTTDTYNERSDAMDLGLAGATVVVAGGTAGMGRAAADCFAADGAKVAVLARTQNELEEGDGCCPHGYGIPGRHRHSHRPLGWRLGRGSPGPGGRPLGTLQRPGQCGWALSRRREGVQRSTPTMSGWRC